MENYAFRSLFGFTIFASFLYCMKVSDVLSAPTTLRIIDVIKNKNYLNCNVQPFFYENNITSVCNNLTYSVDKHDLKSTNILLCFAFLDGLYKVCHSNEVPKEYNNTTTFYSYIQSLVPGEKENDRDEFCGNISDINIAYKQLERQLSYIKSLRFCYQECFDKSGKFTPLCAILAWNKHISDTKQINTNNKSQGDMNEKEDDKDVNPDPQVQHPSPGTDKLSSEALKGNDNKNKTQIDRHTDVNAVITIPPLQGKQNNIKFSIKPNESNIDGINTSPTGNKRKESENGKNDVENIEPPPKSNDKGGIGKEEITDTNSVNNEDGGNKNDGSEDVTTSTLSENTQEQGFSHEWNPHVQDPNNRPEQPEDTAYQGQGITEQRNVMSSYNNIRLDDESHYFTYFSVLSLISIAAYIGYYNKQKILAIVLEGRRSRNRGRRRSSAVNYTKLDCTLEEAVTSQCNANVTHVIY
ncbi:trans-Golgi network integral membrane protein 1 isoform X2 [Bombus terrestris]|uniref:Trans-Golgi network integral membrane protein 1 isoform X2 n=1 Tax=Bombus terrestris TaxID=30195 RepID=A0A9B0F4Z4_BOMTE|nr:trans-Golgi network integral membrane protein 1 isoform X2 [Bombus terrestris]